jgi:DNA-binding transcriptional ArsR family regulator
MQLNPIKKRILQELWEKGKPLKPLDIARPLEMKNQQAMMHLLNLKSMGYVSTPERNQYAITELGKEALGIPKITKNQALQILSPIPHERAFHFYTKIDHYSGISANGLQDFCGKIQKVSAQAIEFHMPRKDFENWLRNLGDDELARKLAIIREQGLSGEKLRQEIYETTKDRYEELKKLTTQ